MSRLHNALLTFGLAVLLPAFASAQSITVPSTASQGTQVDLVISDPNRPLTAVDVHVSCGDGNTHVLTCLLNEQGEAVINGYSLPGKVGDMVTFTLEGTTATATTLITP